MARNTGSRRFHEILYPILEEQGPLSTTQIYDILNNRSIDYGVKKGVRVNKKTTPRKTRESFTKNQCAQILRVSHFFTKVGKQTELTGSGARSQVLIYETVPVEDVVKKIVNIRHTYQNYDKTMPEFARAAWEKAKGE